MQDRLGNTIRRSREAVATPSTSMEGCLGEECWGPGDVSSVTSVVQSLRALVLERDTDTLGCDGFEGGVCCGAKSQ